MIIFTWKKGFFGLGLLVFFSLHTTTCSRSGDADQRRDNPSENPDEPDTEPVPLTTYVSFLGRGYGNIEKQLCSSSRSDFLLPIHSTEAWDGKIDDWKTISDRLDKWPGEQGLESLRVAIDEQGNLIMAAALGIDASQAKLTLEFGGGLAHSDSLKIGVIKTLYRSGKGFSIVNGEQTENLPQELARSYQDGKTMEVFLSRERLMEGILYLPYWWVRLTVEGPSGLNRTGVLLFQGILEQGHDEPMISDCQIVTGESQTSVATAFPRQPTDIVSRYHDLFIAMLKAVERRIQQASILAGVKVIAPTTMALVIVDEAKITINDPSTQGKLPLFAVSTSDWITNENEFILGTKFFQICGDYVSYRMSDLISGFSTAFQASIARAICEQVVSDQFGKSYWVNNFGVLPKESDPDKEAIVRLGHLLGRLATSQEIFAAMLGTTGDSPDQKRLKFWEILESFAHRSDLFHEFKLGWIDPSTPAHPQWQSARFADSDEDGLADVIEHILGFRPNDPDSDKDGFFDGKEWGFGFDPMNAEDLPQQIVMDQSFSDWVAMLAQRTYVDKGRGSACPAASDISYFSSLVKRHEIIIAALPKESNHPVLWHVFLDFVELGRVLKVVLKTGQKSYLVFESDNLIATYKTTATLGLKGLEFLLTREALKLDEPMSASRLPRVKLQTRHIDDESLCDETEWVTPYFSQR